MSHARLSAFAPDAAHAAASQQCCRLAARYRAETASSKERTTSRTGLLSELREFSDPMFNADRYLQRHMGTSARDTRMFIIHLLVLKDFAEEQLHRRAYLSLPTALRAAQLVTTAEGDLQAIETGLVALQKLIGRLTAITFPSPCPSDHPRAVDPCDPIKAGPMAGLGLITVETQPGIGLSPTSASSSATPIHLSAEEVEALGAVEVAICEGNLAEAVDLYLQLMKKGGTPTGDTGPVSFMGETLYNAILDRLTGQEALYLFDTYLELLLRLNRPEDAADLFLKQRTRLLHSAIQKVTFAGDFPLYTKRISSLFFVFLKLASNHYRKLFGTNRIGKVLRWIVAETDHFAQTLRLRLFQCDVYRHVLHCCRHAFGYCHRLEMIIGIPLLARFQGMFLSDLTALVSRRFDELQAVLCRSASNDSFDAIEVELAQPLFPTTSLQTGDTEDTTITVKLSSSCEELVTAFQAEVAMNMVSLLHPTLHWYEEGIQRVLEGYLAYLHTYVNEMGHTDSQYLTCVTNAMFITQHVIPDLVSALKVKFKQKCLHRLDHLSSDIDTFPQQLLEAFVTVKCESHRLKMIPDTDLGGGGAKDGSAHQGVQVSRSMMDLVLHLSDLSVQLHKTLDHEAVDTMDHLIHTLTSHFSQEHYWLETYTQYYKVQAPKAPALGDCLPLADSYQVFLDLEFFRSVFADVLDPDECHDLRKLQGALLGHHFKQSGMVEKKETEFRSLAKEIITQTLQSNPRLRR